MSLASSVLRTLIRVYRVFVSPVLPPSCRFAPSCSEYAHEAIARHGALGGTWLAIMRLLRCHPFSAGGYDPVPAPPPGPLARPERRTAREVLTRDV